MLSSSPAVQGRSGQMPPADKGPLQISLERSFRWRLSGSHYDPIKFWPLILALLTFTVLLGGVKVRPLLLGELCTKSEFWDKMMCQQYVVFASSCV
jgi:hypothetical protein